MCFTVPLVPRKRRHCSSTVCGPALSGDQSDVRLIWRRFPRRLSILMPISRDDAGVKRTRSAEPAAEDRGAVQVCRRYASLHTRRRCGRAIGASSCAAPSRGRCSNSRRRTAAQRSSTGRSVPARYCGASGLSHQAFGLKTDQMARFRRDRSATSPPVRHFTCGRYVSGILPRCRITAASDRWAGERRSGNDR